MGGGVKEKPTNFAIGGNYAFVIQRQTGLTRRGKPVVIWHGESTKKPGPAVKDIFPPWAACAAVMPANLAEKNPMRPLYLLSCLLLCSALTAEAQYINVRIWPVKVDSFQNSFWNNWGTYRGIQNDTSHAFRDFFLNQTKIRAVLGDDGTNFDNGIGYRSGQTWLPDTVLRVGMYGTGKIPLTLINLDDSTIYTVTFYGSRQRTDSQSTRFSYGSQAVSVLTDTNTTRAAVFTGLAPVKGTLAFSFVNVRTFSYLNAFSIVGVPRHLPIRAKIGIDSTLINYPNSVVRVVDSSTGAGINSTGWYQVAGPSTAIFTQYTSQAAFISGLVPGNYRFELLVHDNVGNTDSAFVNVTLKPVFIPIPPPCPACPLCPPPVVCPPLRTATGVLFTDVNGIPVLKFTYSDGNP